MLLGASGMVLEKEGFGGAITKHYFCILCWLHGGSGLACSAFISPSRQLSLYGKPPSSGSDHCQDKYRDQAQKKKPAAMLVHT